MSEIECPNCPECGKKMVIRHSRFGGFFGCSQNPKCKMTLSMDEDEWPDPDGLDDDVYGLDHLLDCGDR